METAAWQQLDAREAFCGESPAQGGRLVLVVMSPGGRGRLRWAGGQVGTTTVRVAE